MKVVQINSVCTSGSTGKICVAISEILRQQNIENYIFYASGSSDNTCGGRYMSPWEVKWNAGLARVFGNWGFTSFSATKRLVRELDRIQPDIVHLHNLHAHNVHLGVLFAYLKKKKIKILWTFHDCWAFTGYCPYYDMAGCSQWKEECRNCPQKKHFTCFFDRSRYVYSRKKELFTGLDLTIVTPSHWLAGQVKQSFLKHYPIKVIHNGIDLTVFRPRESNFRQKYHLENKFILLGVAFDWGARKGLDVFIELSKRLDDRFQIVLVGTSDAVDQQLPDTILSIHRTANPSELSEIYTAADLFVNPTREENYPTVHMEALACGTGVLSFDTGGCSEMLDKTCGCVVEKNNLKALERAVCRIAEDCFYDRDACVSWAQQFDSNSKYNAYIQLYKTMLDEGERIIGNT